MRKFVTFVLAAFGFIKVNTPKQAPKPSTSRKLHLEVLEDRLTPSSYSASSAQVEHAQSASSSNYSTQSNGVQLTVDSSGSSSTTASSSQSGSFFMGGSTGYQSQSFTVGTNVSAGEAYDYSLLRNSSRQTEDSQSKAYVNVLHQETGTLVVDSNTDGRSVTTVTTGYSVNQTERANDYTSFTVNAKYGSSGGSHSSSNTFDTTGSQWQSISYAHYSLKGWQDASFRLKETRDFTASGSQAEYSDWYYSGYDNFSFSQRESQSLRSSERYSLNVSGWSTSDQGWTDFSYGLSRSVSASMVTSSGEYVDQYAGHQYTGIWSNSSLDNNFKLFEQGESHSYFFMTGGYQDSSFLLSIQERDHSYDNGFAYTGPSWTWSEHFSENTSSRDYVFRTYQSGWAPEESFAASNGVQATPLGSNEYFAADLPHIAGSMPSMRGDGSPVPSKSIASIGTAGGRTAVSSKPYRAPSLGGMGSSPAISVLLDEQLAELFDPERRFRFGA